MSSGEVTNASESANEIVERLIGCSLPAIELIAAGGYPVTLDRFAHGWGVVYFYSGSPEERSSSAEDAALQAGFRHQHEDLSGLRVRALGVSNEPHYLQDERRTAGRIPHDLLSDTDMRVGSALGLPTEVDSDGITRYRRIVLLTHNGNIQHVLYPIENGSRCASQVVALLRGRI
jgi:peroxiredoxin